MKPPRCNRGHQRLSLPWRRALVTIGVAAAVGAAAPAYAATPSRPLLLLSLVSGLAGLVCLWLLAEVFAAWLVDEAEPAEREAAEVAVRRAYGVLAVLAVGAVFYLSLPQAPGLATLVQGRERAWLWTIAVTVFLLPPALLAWGVGSGPGNAREVGPLELIRARFRGSSGDLHRAAGLALLGALPLLIVGGAPVGERGAWWYGSVFLALLSVLGCAWVLTRSLQHEARSDEHA